MRVLFLCTGNSCRSQMAEGWARRLYPELIDPCSAGVRPTGTVDPLAVTVMAEAGVDITGQRSKHMDELAGEGFDVIITVCGSADEECPVFPGTAKRLHRGFDDPPRLSAGALTQEERLLHYWRVRDEIRDFIGDLPEILKRTK